MEKSEAQKKTPKWWLSSHGDLPKLFGGVPKIGVPQNIWFIMENTIKMDDLGGTTVFGNIHLFPHLLTNDPSNSSFNNRSASFRRS